MQLNLFSEEEVLKPQVVKGELVACKTCGTEHPHTNEHFHIRNRVTTLKYGVREYLFYVCKKCHFKNWKIVQDLVERYKHLKTSTCDCCGKKSDRLCLDHCHETKKFRGWLCNNCNTGLGMLGDNKEGLNVAFKYLESCNDKT